MTAIAPGAILPIAEKVVPGRRPAVAQSGFAVPTASSASSPGAFPLAAGTSTVFAPGAMLALQEQTGLAGDGEAALADREARKHAQDVLEALASLQKDLLAGGNATQSLSRLAALAQMMPTLHDPVLARVVGSIRLRAQLEILRLTPRLTERNRLFEQTD